MQSDNTLQVVLDSVVWISAFLRKTGLTAELIRQASLTTQLYTAEEILAEIRRVLLDKPHIRKRYTYLDHEVEAFIKEVVRELAITVSPLPDTHAVERDPKDDMIIACAVVAQADYIVTRDRDLLDLEEYQDIKIVSPEDFMEVLRRKPDKT